MVVAAERSRRRAGLKPRADHVEPPIDLTRAQAERARFCFLGEFGYEIISWIPYLLYLKRSLGLRLRTASRPGSEVFYDFSDDHVELDASYIGGVWGCAQSYARARVMFPRQRLVHPGERMINRRDIRVDGAQWTTRDIHRAIREVNYERLDLSAVPPWSPLPHRPVAVINNKYFVQWSGTFDGPVNFFDRASLIALRDLLTRKGYAVVYNHFVEPNSVDEHEPLDDLGIFGEDAHSWDLRRDYSARRSPGERNRLQIGLFNGAEFIIGPQGGNLYLPAVCRRPIYLLMRAGDYIDYTELGRLYNTPVEAFYEPKHLLLWLEATLPRRG